VVAYDYDYADGMGMMRRFWMAAEALDPAVAHGTTRLTGPARAVRGTRSW
jgi:hypothetical protein